VSDAEIGNIVEHVVAGVFILIAIIIAISVHYEKKKKLKEESSAQFRVHQAYSNSYTIDFRDESRLFSELNDSGDFYSRAITSRYNMYVILVETITSKNESIPECTQVAIGAYNEHMSLLRFLITSHKERLSILHNETKDKAEKMLSAVKSDNADYINNYPK
jgi:hypothetical protein